MQLDRRAVTNDYNCSMAVLEKRYAGHTRALNRIVEIRNNIVYAEGVEYIQVHPTFLYEIFWNLGLLFLLLIYSRHKKFDGELLCLYLIGYGAGRVWIEDLRTDPLFLWGTSLAVSELLSILLILISFFFLVRTRILAGKKKNG